MGKAQASLVLHLHPYLLRAGHAKRAIPEQQKHVVAGPRPSLSHAAARACGWPGGDFAVITSTVFVRPGPTGPI